jgi:hypothetical protein
MFQPIKPFEHWSILPRQLEHHRFRFEPWRSLSLVLMHDLIQKVCTFSRSCSRADSARIDALQRPFCGRAENDPDACGTHGGEMIRSDRPCSRRAKHEPLLAGWAHGPVELVRYKEGNREDACIDRNDHQNDLKLTHRPFPSRSKIGQHSAANDHPGPRQEHDDGSPLGGCRRSLSRLDVPKPVRR